MKKDEIIVLLQQQISLLQQQISLLQEQLQEANRKADALLEEVATLRNHLEHKSEEEAKQKRIIKGLAKIAGNKSERQAPAPAPQDTIACQPPEKKERARTNNGARRKQHLEVEVVDANGKAVLDEKGEPLKHEVFNFGKYKGWDVAVPRLLL